MPYKNMNQKKSAWKKFLNLKVLGVKSLQPWQSPLTETLITQRWWNTNGHGSGKLCN